MTRRRREALLGVLLCVALLLVIAGVLSHEHIRARIESDPILLVATIFVGMAVSFSLVVAIYDAIAPWERP